MTNQNVQTNRHGPQIKGCNQSDEYDHKLENKNYYVIFVRVCVCAGGGGGVGGRGRVDGGKLVSFGQLGHTNDPHICFHKNKNWNGLSDYKLPENRTFSTRCEKMFYGRHKTSCRKDK